MAGGYHTSALVKMCFFLNSRSISVPTHTMGALLCNQGQGIDVFNLHLMVSIKSSAAWPFKKQPVFACWREKGTTLPNAITLQKCRGVAAGWGGNFREQLSRFPRALLEKTNQTETLHHGGHRCSLLMCTTGPWEIQKNKGYACCEYPGAAVLRLRTAPWALWR